MGRTKKNIKFKIPEKPRKIKGFRSGGYRIATTISSQPRYDRFDTSAYMLNSIVEDNDYSIFDRTGRPVMSCCGARNLRSLYASQNFDRGHSLRLA